MKINEKSALEAWCQPTFACLCVCANSSFGLENRACLGSSASAAHLPEPDRIWPLGLCHWASGVSQGSRSCQARRKPPRPWSPSKCQERTPRRARLKIRRQTPRILLIVGRSYSTRFAQLFDCRFFAASYSARDSLSTGWGKRIPGCTSLGLRGLANSGGCPQNEEGQ